MKSSLLTCLLFSLLHSSLNHIVAHDEKSCPLLLPENFTQNHLLSQLTSPCRYNKKHTPIDPMKCAPLKVTARIHVYHLRSGSETNAEFKVQLLLQLHWKDPRLEYRHYAPHITEMVGERNFIQNIWTPHIYLTNERDSLVLGLYRRDMLVSILPDGDMLFSTRLKTTIFCWVQLGKFPFDQQKCHLVMDSWRYNASELLLEWDSHPVTIPPSKPYLTEYSLMDTVTQVQDQFAEPSAVADTNHSYMYSSLTLTFILNRQYGFYLMDFYVPSILLVCISWVSFWMAPDAVPGRTILGASTMLTFFQLGIETGSSLPNVSYIRSNDVWFFACTVFIFLSLAEFAFVNTIWRYGDQKVQLKKPTSKYILKSSVHPHLQQDQPSHKFKKPRDGFYSKDNEITPRPRLDVIPDTQEPVMSMQDIAIWVDEKSRIVFPLAFSLFNAAYWGVLYQS
ncbi:hypothetical protein M8J76_011355 [Diaphorina citri]|nr:hypothetical protein M8J75_014282 [Diaphorina citri]KAI5730215.1 hypothetical protein M8J76_011355 [Diaphorina citri]